MNSASRTSAVYLGDHTALSRTLDGLLLYVDTRDISLAPHVLMGGDWEPQVTLALKRVIKPGMRTADIGANFGYYATLLGKLVGPSGFVQAFEPNPRLFELLAGNLEVNGLRPISACYRLALSDRAGEAGFFLFRKHMGGSSFAATEQTATAYFDALDEIKVATERLDAIAGAERLDFIKIDAEGAELKILAGAEELMRSRRPLQIFMELAPAMLGAAEASAALIHLRTLGFAVHLIRDDGAFEQAPPEGDAALMERPWSELYLARGVGPEG